MKNNRFWIEHYAKNYTEESERYRKTVIIVKDSCSTMERKNPSEFRVVTLKEILQELNLPINGRKAELVARLMEADPEGQWIKRVEAKENAREGKEEEDSNMKKRELDVLEREASIARREAALLERELQAAREEIERMRMASTSATDYDEGPGIRGRNSIRQLSLNNIFKLLSDFDGDHEMYNTWENQIRLLKNTYELIDEETR